MARDRTSTAPKPPKAVQIAGLRELQQDFASADKKLRRDFNKVLRSAGDPIVEDARRRYPLPNPERGYKGYRIRTGRTIRGIKTATVYGGVSVTLMGTGRWRHLPGQEWGAKEMPQFVPVRRRGSFFWPAWEIGRDRADELVEEALDRAVAVMAGHSRAAGRVARRARVAGRVA